MNKINLTYIEPKYIEDMRFYTLENVLFNRMIFIIEQYEQYFLGIVNKSQISNICMIKYPADHIILILHIQNMAEKNLYFIEPNQNNNLCLPFLRKTISMIFMIYLQKSLYKIIKDIEDHRKDIEYSERDFIQHDLLNMIYKNIKNENKYYINNLIMKNIKAHDQCAYLYRKVENLRINYNNLYLIYDRFKEYNKNQIKIINNLLFSIIIIIRNHRLPKELIDIILTKIYNMLKKIIFK